MPRARSATSEKKPSCTIYAICSPLAPLSRVNQVLPAYSFLCVTHCPLFHTRGPLALLLVVVGVVVFSSPPLLFSFCLAGQFCVFSLKPRAIHSEPASCGMTQLVHVVHIPVHGLPVILEIGRSQRRKKNCKASWWAHSRQPRQLYLECKIDARRVCECKHF